MRQSVPNRRESVVFRNERSRCADYILWLPISILRIQYSE